MYLKETKLLFTTIIYNNFIQT